MSAPVTAHDFGDIRWRGHWIWVPEEPIAPTGFLAGTIDPHASEAHGLFRKVINLDQVPARVPTRITADSRYALYVNGQEAFRGPIRSQPRRLHYDLFDIAPLLTTGENVLAIYAKYFGTPKSYWMPAVPNLTLGKRGIVVFEADLGGDWVVSDGSWKAHKSDAWTDDQPKGDDAIPPGVPIEIFDARRLPHNWQEAGFDDSEWGMAQVVPAVHIGGFTRTQPPTDPYGPLYPRPIAKLDGAVRNPHSARVATLDGLTHSAESTAVERVAAAVGAGGLENAKAAQLPLTVTVPEVGSTLITLDMGGIVSGLAGFELDAPAGTVIDIAYSEEPARSALSFDTPRTGTRYTARGEHDRFQAFDSNGFRYANIVAHSVAGSVTLREFWLRESIYPWQEGAGFSCDDPELNRIYTAGVRTVALNSHDAFIDCPTREQRAWVGDSVVHQMVHLATNNDWRLAWHYLTLGNSPRSDGILPMSVAGDIEGGAGFTIPDWALHWVHGIYNRYRFSGDRDAVQALLPTVELVLRWYVPYQNKGGLLKDVSEWNLVDWSSVSGEDTSSILTALWARGLNEFAEMAGWLEENGSRHWAQKLYEKAKAGFDVFWDEGRGTYVDHIKDGEQQRAVNQLAGALAIVSGLAPQDRWARIIDTITDGNRLVVRSWTGGGDGEYSIQKIAKQFQGIYEIDWDVENEIVIAQPFMSYVVHDAVAQAGKAAILPDLYTRWSQFLVDGYDTIGECWGWGTHVHGWSCTPTRDMIFYTLGVTPAEPGYTVARIAPRLGRLAVARGSVPTPHGFITVEVSEERVLIDSPVPVLLELEGQEPQQLKPGKHEVDVAAKQGVM